MMNSEEKRSPFLGNRTIRDGSVTLEKLSDEVREMVSGGSDIVLIDESSFDALPEKKSGVFYFITE